MAVSMGAELVVTVRAAAEMLFQDHKNLGACLGSPQPESKAITWIWDRTKLNPGPTASPKGLGFLIKALVMVG